MPTANSLGERIRNRRKELGLTLRELASRAGLSFSFLSDVERCKRSVGADSLLALGQALGLPLDQLMKGEIRTSGEDVQLPASLMRFATDEDVPFRTAICLYWMQRTIMDHRIPPKRVALERIDWLRFYEAVKEWL